MRKWQFALLAGLIFLSFLALAQADDTSPAAVEALGEAMAVTGATPGRLIVNAWSRLPQAELTDGQLAALAEEAMSRLDVAPEDYELVRSHSERHRLVRAEALAAGRQMTVSVQVIYPTWDDRKKPEAYIVVNVEIASDPAGIAAWRARVKGAADCGGGSPRISTCLVGWLDGKLDKDEWPIRLHNAGNALGASVLDTLIQPGFASITGYSPALPDSLIVADKQINVNMAMRYSPYENRTYVIVASPVIPGEY
jgi:hypothetical protein